MIAKLERKYAAGPSAPVAELADAIPDMPAVGIDESLCWSYLRRDLPGLGLGREATVADAVGGRFAD